MRKLYFKLKFFLKSCKKKIRCAVNIILLLTSVGILVYFCVIDNNLINFLKMLPYLNLWWVSAAFLLMVLYWQFDSLVIKNIFFLMPKENAKLKRSFFFKLSVIGQYFAAITPLGVGGQPAQIMELCKKGISQSSAVAVMTRKFYIYQFVLAIYSILAAAVYYTNLEKICPELIILMIIGLSFQSFVVFWMLIVFLNEKFIIKIIEYFLIFFKKLKIIKNSENKFEVIKNKICEFTDNNKILSKNKKTNLKLYALTFAQITFLLLIPFCVYKAFNHAPFPLLNIICTQSVINTVASFTPLPGSSGTAEKGFLILFGSFFEKNEIAVSMILCRFITLYFSIIVGLVLRIFGKKSHNKAN